MMCGAPLIQNRRPNEYFITANGLGFVAARSHLLPLGKENRQKKIEIQMRRCQAQIIKQTWNLVLRKLFDCVNLMNTVWLGFSCRKERIPENKMNSPRLLALMRRSTLLNTFNSANQQPKFRQSIVRVCHRELCRILRASFSSCLLFGLRSSGNSALISRKAQVNSVNKYTTKQSKTVEFFRTMINRSPFHNANILISR